MTKLRGLLDSTFPFHLLFDSHFRLVQVGRSLARIVPVELGVQLEGQFSIERPSTLKWANFESFVHLPERILAWVKCTQNQMTLKGVFVFFGEEGLVGFLGAPMVQNLAALKGLGLQMDDFALYDSTPEMLSAFEFQSSSFKKAQEFREALQKKADELATLNENLERLVAERTENLRAIFRTIPVGVFTIDEGLCIRPDFSASLLGIVGAEQLEGDQTLRWLLAELSEHEKKQIEFALESSFFQPKELNWEVNLHLLPREVRREGKTLGLKWTAMDGADGMVVSVLVVVEDLTEVRAFEREAALQDKKIKRIGKLVMRPRHVFRRFLLGSIEAMESLKRGDDADLSHCLRVVHTLKGNSSGVGFVDIARLAHSLEDEMKALAQGTRCVLNEAARAKVGDICAELVAYREIFDEIWNSQDLITGGGIAELFLSWSAPLRKVAKSLEKEDPELQLVQTEILQLSEKEERAFGDSIAHLMRNSIDHGIETRKEREACGKPPQGKIELWVSESRVVLKDDGRGLNLVALRTQSEQGGLSDAQLAERIFTSGVTTTSQVTETSGRGVGMDAVRASLGSVGWTMKVEFLGGMEGDAFRPFQFVMERG